MIARNDTSSVEFFNSLATDFEDYGEFRVTRIEGDQGDFQIECFIEIDECPDFHRDWILKCKGVKKSSVRLGTFEHLELSDQHVLLSEFQDDIGMLGFNGKPLDPSAVAGCLYQTHFDFAGEWIPFARYVNGSDIIDLLKGGFGVLAEGPLPFVNLYEVVLQRFGIRTLITSMRKPAFWNGEAYEDIPKVHALLLDESYVVAEDFEPAKITY